MAMWNNSSAPPFTPGNMFETFDGQASCLLWHLQNTTVFQGYAAAQETCSAYENTEELGTATAVISWLLGLLIITGNIAVILGIIRTAQLHKPLYIYMANLAVSDLVGGVGLLYRTVDPIELMRMRSMMNIVTFLMYSQVVSASALSLLSVNSYIAVRHHVFFHNHAYTAKRDAVIAIVSSWLVLSLFVFLPSMGWNCLDVNTENCLLFYHIVFIGLVATLAIVLVILMLFTNISTFVALKQRQKKRFGAKPGQGNNQPRNAAQIEAERKHKRSVQKARTVLIYVVVAFVFWLLPLVLIPICLTRENGCPALDGPHGRALLITVNSAINPLASIIRTPDLRRGIWQTVTDIGRALVSRIRRRNPANPQGQQQPAQGQQQPAQGQQQPAQDQQQPAQGQQQPAQGQQQPAQGQQQPAKGQQQPAQGQQQPAQGQQQLAQGQQQPAQGQQQPAQGQQQPEQGQQQPAPGDAPNLPDGTARDTGQTIPTGQLNAGHSKSPVNRDTTGTKEALTKARSNSLAVIDID